MSNFQPQSTTQLAAFLADAGPVSVHVPACPPTGATRIDLSALHAIVDHAAADMTMTVQGGVSVATIQRTLNEYGQCLPLDVAEPEGTTIGDVVARNLNGSRRFGYGTARDYLIGLTGVDGSGRIFRSGGRVVKNVAGYDLCKLLTGSQGTLAVIAEVTLKIRPKPAATGGLCAEFEDCAQLEQVLSRLLTSATRPVVVDVVSHRTGAVQLVLAYDGTRAEVDWQLQTAAEELAVPRMAVWGEKEVSDHLSLGTAYQRAAPADGSFRAGVRPSRLLRCLAALRPYADVVAQAGNGGLSGQIEEPQRMPALEAAVVEQGGWFLSGGQTPLSAASGSAAGLTRKVRQVFDPRGILNPHLRNPIGQIT